MARRLELIQAHITSSSFNELSKQYIKDPLDFLNLDALFPQQVNQKRKQLRPLLESQISPLITQNYEQNQFPFEIVQFLQTMDLFHIPTESNGIRQQSFTELSGNIYELARIDTSLATFVTAQIALCVEGLHILGTEEQKQMYLEKLCKFEVIGGWGWSEPEFGSDVYGLQTTAQPVEGGYILNGMKKWIANANFAHILFIFARNTQKNIIEGFIVDTKSVGVKIQDIKQKLALRIVQNSFIELDSVFVPNNMKLNNSLATNGFSKVLSQSRIIVTMMTVGTIAQIYETSIEYIRKREQFNAPIAAFQLSQEKIARLLSIFSSVFLLTMNQVQMIENSKQNSAQPSMVKAYVTKLGREAAHIGRELLGGNGILIENKVMKILADMEVLYTYEGTYDVNMLGAGKAITGIAAFKAPSK